MSKNLTAAERVDKTEKAVRMSVRGVTNTEIAKQLGISRNLVASLIKNDLANRAEHTDNAKEKAKAHYREIIRAAWQSYSAVDDRSLNKSGHLNAAIRAQERIDKIDGNEAPARNEHSGPGGGPIEHMDVSEREEKFEQLFRELGELEPEGAFENGGDG